MSWCKVASNGVHIRASSLQFTIRHWICMKMIGIDTFNTFFTSSIYLMN